MLDFHTHKPVKNAIINIDTLEHIDIESEYYYSLGNHPWNNPYTIQEIEDYLEKYPQIIAIGECGIDKLRSNQSLEQQIRVMEEQVLLSEKLKLPILLHIVKGFNEIIKLRKNLSLTQHWVIHGFSNYKQADSLLTNGFYLSFGAKLLIDKKLQMVFKNAPLNRLFLETDNSDIKIQKIYTFASELRDIKLEELISQIQNNLSIITNGKLAGKTRTSNRKGDTGKTQK